jgi:hypothetical protein
MNISIDQSRLIYDYLISTLTFNNLNGDYRGRVINKAYYSTIDYYFINTSFKEFLYGPQDKKSLLEFYKQLTSYYRGTFMLSGDFEEKYLCDEKGKEEDKKKEVSQVDKVNCLLKVFEPIMQTDRDNKALLEENKVLKERNDRLSNANDKLLASSDKLMKDICVLEDRLKAIYNLAK